jgi:hypothetical protein
MDRSRTRRRKYAQGTLRNLAQLTMRSQ